MNGAPFATTQRVVDVEVSEPAPPMPIHLHGLAKTIGGGAGTRRWGSAAAMASSEAR